MIAKTIPILMAFLLTVDTREDVILSTSVNGNGSVPCSDKQVNITCIGSETNSIDIWFEPFGHHTYERTSQRQVMVGPIELELINVTANPNNDLLSTFHIEGRVQFNVNVSSLMVTCSDGLSTKSLPLQLNSGQCFENNPNTMQGVTCGSCNTSAMKTFTSLAIDWEPPSCLGWEKIETYNISVCSSSGCTINETDVSEFCYCSPDKGNHIYEVNATNVCGETTLLVSSHIFLEKMDSMDVNTSTSETSDSLPVVAISVATAGGFIFIIVVSVAVVGLACCVVLQRRKRKQ